MAETTEQIITEDKSYARVNGRAKKNRMSHQFTVFLSVVLLINTCIAVVITTYCFSNEYLSLIESRVDVAGSNMKIFIEDLLSLRLQINSLDGIEKELEKDVKVDKDVIYANVVDENCKVLYSYPTAEKGKLFYPEYISSLIKKNVRKTFATYSTFYTFIPVIDPLYQRVVGGINIGVSRHSVYNKALGTMLYSFITFVIFILFTLAVLYWNIKRATKPLELLADNAMQLGKGDLSVRANVTENNEIGFLAESFNEMAERLESSFNELHSAREKILLRENKLKDAQAQLVLNEKMASLGVLISGIAHEINTPAGAIANVASDLRDRTRKITDLLINIHRLPEKELPRFCAFVDEFSINEFNMDSGMQWKKSSEIGKWLTEAGVQNKREVAAILAKYNLLDKGKLAQYEDLLKQPWVMELSDSIGTINLGIKICDSSIKKITDIVRALKYYAYTDMDKIASIDINENIENVLLLMNNKLKYDVKVEKELGPLPLIRCTSEISQVWTNLISNSYDAIKEVDMEAKKGLIRIETREQGEWISVQVMDNGSGISGENVSRLFDPFFTTKGIGKGTGLGLSIVSGIVKKHEGRISVDSVPGKTVFTVLLPREHGNGGWKIE